MSFRDRVRLALGLAPVDSWDPRPLEAAVVRSCEVFLVPEVRLAIDPRGFPRLEPTPGAYATSGGFRLRPAVAVPDRRQFRTE